MIVVSDTSPLIALAHLGRLAMLETLFARIMLPPGVDEEFRRFEQGRFARLREETTFLDVRAPRDVARVEQLATRLDRGESEALALALELRPDAVLVDELAARKTAASLGFTCIGTLAVLVLAKNAGLLQEVGPLIDRLQSELDFRVSSHVRTETLRRAKELPGRD